MTDKELLKKLSSLKYINPSSDFKVRSREILLSQISNSAIDYRPGLAIKFLTFTKNFMFSLPQPALALVAIFVLLGTGMFYSNRYAKPNSSLYIARTISEKAMLMTTFDSVEKNKLETDYALNHAQDIAAVLVTNSSDQKMNDNLKAEIKILKTKLAKTSEDMVYSAESGMATSGVSIAISTSTPLKSIEAAEKAANNNNYSEAIKLLEEAKGLMK